MPIQQHQTHTIAGHGTLATYLTGYVLAIILTLLAFAAVLTKPFSEPAIVTIITIAAVCQAGVHMWFFLHMFRKSTPLWNTVSLAFVVVVIILLVAGSMFILLTANNNMMPPPFPPCTHPAPSG